MADVARPIFAQHPTPWVCGKSGTTSISRVHCKSMIAGIAPPSSSRHLPDLITLWEFITLGAFWAASVPLSVKIFTIVTHAAHSATISIILPLSPCSPSRYFASWGFAWLIAHLGITILDLFAPFRWSTCANWPILSGLPIKEGRIWIAQKTGFHSSFEFQFWQDRWVHLAVHYPKLLGEFRYADILIVLIG